MKQCPKCSGNLADFVEVCPYCGTPTPLAATAQFAGAFAAAPFSGPVETSGKAIASLISGVIFFLWPFSAIAAVVLGHLALADIRRSAERLTGRGLAIGGLVTGYIGVSFAALLIFAAILIPNLLRARMAANEASAVGSLRTYNTAMVTYATTCPTQGYPASLAKLGPGASPADCDHADLVDPQLGTGLPVKNGYRFFYSPASFAPDGHVVKYVLAADPVSPGTTGGRHFFTDETGVIRFSTHGSADVHSQRLE